MNAIIIYWSGTGNTESIALRIKEDLNVAIKSVEDIRVEEALAYDTLILGCPAMGAEELEDTIFKPFWDELVNANVEKRVYLFGSYGWGNKEWIEAWEEEARSSSLILGAKGLAVNGDISNIIEGEYQEFIKSIY